MIISQGDISKADSSPCCLLNGPPFPPAIKATSGPRQGGDGSAKPSSPFYIDSKRNEQVEVIVWDSVWSRGDSREAKNKIAFLWVSFNQYNPFLSIHFLCYPFLFKYPKCLFYFTQLSQDSPKQCLNSIQYNLLCMVDVTRTGSQGCVQDNALVHKTCGEECSCCKINKATLIHYL